MDLSQQPSVSDDNEAASDNHPQNISGDEPQGLPHSSQQPQQDSGVVDIKVENDNGQYGDDNVQNDNDDDNGDNVQYDGEQLDDQSNVVQHDIHSSQAFMGAFDGQTFSDLIRESQVSAAATHGHPQEHSPSDNALEDSRPRSSSPIDPEADRDIGHGTPPVSPIRSAPPVDINDNQSIYEYDEATGGYVYRDLDTGVSFTITKEQRAFLSQSSQKVPPWAEQSADVPPGDPSPLQVRHPTSLSQPLGQQSSDQQPSGQQSSGQQSTDHSVPAPSTKSPSSDSHPQPDPIVPASERQSNANFRDHHDLSMSDSVLAVALGEGDGGSGYDDDSLFDSDGIVRSDYHERHERRLAEAKVRAG